MWRVIAGIVAALAILLFAADRLFLPDLSRVQAASTEILARDGQLLTPFPAAGGVWRLRTAPGAVDPRYLDLLLAAEDRQFRAHGGVDLAALLRAAWQDLRAGRIVSGGSTLTMQTARLLEPHRRGVLGKLHDLVRAMQLERRFSKDEILGLYLTLAPFGGNVEGVRAASLVWFGHEAAHLSESEAALLVAIPQSPARRRPDRHLAAAEGAASRLVGRLAAAGRLPASWSPAVDFSGLGTGLARHDPPRSAWAFCARLAHEATAGAVIRSSIDAALQVRLEALVAREMAAEAPAAGAAVMVVDNASREIRASVGGRGPGFPGADLDLTRRRRSPGSALKPFIYGMAFDALLLHPLTEIADAPGRVGGYAPHNFDYQFHGTVTAQAALRQSFNVPAVQVLDRVGPERFVAALRQAGARVALPGRHASLAVALGGLGISLSDMVTLYAAAAGDGRAGRLAERAGEVVARLPFLGPLAVFYLRQIMEGSPPPPGMAYASLTGGRAVAFKTGTSYGFRDAWAVGYSPGATIGVWTGRVEGSPRPGAFGRANAAPLMLAAFGLLPPEAAAEAMPPAGAILAARTEDLPAGLRWLGRAAEAGVSRPVLDFPPPGSTVDLVAAPGGGFSPVRLQAKGGVPPFRWVVNDAPVAGRDDALDWVPDGPGMARVVVIDAQDRAGGGVFWLSKGG